MKYHLQPTLARPTEPDRPNASQLIRRSSTALSHSSMVTESLQLSDDTSQAVKSGLGCYLLIKAAFGIQLLSG